MSLKILEQWSPGVFQLNTLSLIIGKRASGKTNLVKDLCYKIKDKIDSAIVFSPTESFTKEYTSFFANFFQKSVVHSEYNERILQEQIYHQKKIKFNRRPNILVVLDDCCYNKKNILKSWLLYDMACNSRGLKITCIITVQNPSDVSIDLRSNSDYFFCFSANQKSYRQSLYKKYFGYFQNFKTFEKTFMEHTQHYHCFVQDNTSFNIPKKQFYYKALFIQLLLQLKKRRELARIFLPERSFKFFQNYPGLTQYVGTKLLLYCG